MEEYISLLKNTDLFKGVAEAAIGPLLQSMGARKRHFNKGNFVFYAGDDINTIRKLPYRSRRLLGKPKYFDACSKGTTIR